MQDHQYPKGPDVYWEKWIDPYQLIADDLAWNEFDENQSKTNKNIKSGQDITQYEREFENDQGPGFIQVPNIKHLFTPFGIIPMTEHSCPGKLFKFWTGHANFNITRELALLISRIPGVETLNIWTRYRFRIGIGKLFDDKIVMFNIKEAMIGYYKDQKHVTTVSSEPVVIESN